MYYKCEREWTRTLEPMSELHIRINVKETRAFDASSQRRSESNSKRSLVRNQGRV